MLKKFSRGSSSEIYYTRSVTGALHGFTSLVGIDEEWLRVWQILCVTYGSAPHKNILQARSISSVCGVWARDNVLPRFGWYPRSIEPFLPREGNSRQQATTEGRRCEPQPCPPTPLILQERSMRKWHSFINLGEEQLFHFVRVVFVDRLYAGFVCNYFVRLLYWSTAHSRNCCVYFFCCFNDVLWQLQT